MQEASRNEYTAAVQECVRLLQDHVTGINDAIEEIMQARYDLIDEA